MASESARELKEIQQQINAESQNSLGKTSMGSSMPGALFQGNPSTQRTFQQKPHTRNGLLNVQSGEFKKSPTVRYFTSVLFDVIHLSVVKCECGIHLRSHFIYNTDKCTCPTLTRTYGIV